MRVKPWPIILIALIHILAPFTNIYFSAHVNGVTYWDYLEYLYYGNNLLKNFLWFFLPVFTGLSILRFRKWSYALLLIFTISVSIFSLLQWFGPTNSNQNYPLITFIILQSINIIILVYFLHPAVRNVYLKPSLRWWEQKPRFLIKKELLIESHGKTFPAILANISEGGVMIETSAPLRNGDFFQFPFNFEEFKLSLKAQVAYKTSNNYGSFFISVRPNQKDLFKLIEKLKSLDYPTRNPPPPLLKSFKEWLLNLAKGKGIFPFPENSDIKNKD